MSFPISYISTTINNVYIEQPYHLYWDDLIILIVYHVALLTLTFVFHNGIIDFFPLRFKVCSTLQ